MEEKYLQENNAWQVIFHRLLSLRGTPSCQRFKAGWIIDQWLAAGQEPAELLGKKFVILSSTEASQTKNKDPN